jgi:hypothetical protein
MVKDVSEFPQRLIEAFDRIESDATPPHATVFRVAKQMGLTARVDGKGPEAYRLKGAKLIEAVEDGEFDDDLTVTFKECPEWFTVCWLDAGEVSVRRPRAKAA